MTHHSTIFSLLPVLSTFHKIAQARIACLCFIFVFTMEKDYLRGLISPCCYYGSGAQQLPLIEIRHFYIKNELCAGYKKKNMPCQLSCVGLRCHFCLFLSSLWLSYGTLLIRLALTISNVPLLRFLTYSHTRHNILLNQSINLLTVIAWETVAFCIRARGLRINCITMNNFKITKSQKELI